METLPHDNFITDGQLAKLYREKEEGRSCADALAATGVAHLSEEELKEVEVLWDLYSVIEDEGKKYVANMELVKDVVDDASEYITEKIEEKGEKSLEGGDVASPFQSLMQLNWLIGAPIAVLVLAVVLVTNISGPTSPMTTPEGGEEMKSMAVGEVADALSAAAPSDPMSEMFAVLVKEGERDAQILSDANENVAMVGSDSDELSAISESYDPSTF